MPIIKELRKSSGVTQQQLASMLGIMRGAFANIKDGRREPDISTLIRLADYFNVSVDHLINHGKGNLAMDEKPRTFPSTDKWTKEMNEDFDNADTETRVLILTRWGYDPDHTWAAHRYFPWQFSVEKEPTPVAEDGPLSPPGYDLLSPEDRALVDSMTRRLIQEKNQAGKSSPSSEAGG